MELFAISSVNGGASDGRLSNGKEDGCLEGTDKINVRAFALVFSYHKFVRPFHKVFHVLTFLIRRRVAGATSCAHYDFLLC